MQQTDMRPDSRRYPRYPVSLMASLLKDDWLHEQLLGHSDVYDLSVRGCQIFSEIALKPGNFVGLRLTLPLQEPPVRVNLASVRWSTGEQCGLEFRVMASKDQERLNQFVTSLPSEVSHKRNPPSGTVLSFPSTSGTPAKRSEELVRKVFEVLTRHPGGLPAKEVVRKVEESLGVMDCEKRSSWSNQGLRQFEKLLRISTITPVKAGWLVKSKGRWLLTEQGKQAYHDLSEPEQFALEARRLYSRCGASRPQAMSEEGEDPLDALHTYEEAEETAWAEVERHLRTMSPHDVHALVAALLRAMGYHVSWVARPGQEMGIDIVAHRDPLAVNVPRVKVQVKHQTDSVTVDGLRSFMAVLGEQDVGLLVSLGGFTEDAGNEARMQEKRNMTLVDLEQLFDLWLEHYANVPEPDKRLLPLKPVYYLAPST